MKVFVIGPIPPYRGGISHSNLTLCKALSKNNEVTCISFKRQFPSFLYPGKKQVDGDAKKPASLDARFILDSINPITWIKVYNLIKKEKPDILAFQWWSPFFTPSYTFIAWLARCFTKTKVSAICQNVVSHENRFIETFLTKFFFRNTDFLITYSSSDEKHAKELMPEKKSKCIIEPTYDSGIGKKPIGREKAKNALGFKGKNILFFGFVRPYKGLIYLLKAMPEILKKHKVTLHIVGEFWDDKKAYLEEIKILGIENNVKIVDKYVTDKEMIKYFSAADAVVLPYTSSTESGVIQLAYGLNTPIITTDVGGNKDLIENGVTGLLAKPENSKSISAAVIKFYGKNIMANIKRNMLGKKSIFSWTKNKEKIFFGHFR